MSDDHFASLGVKAADVSAVESSVVAEAEARAFEAEAEEHARLLSEVDEQLATLQKQEKSLSSQRFSTALNRQLKAVQARIQTAKDRRTRLLEARAAREDLRSVEPHHDQNALATRDEKEPRIAEGESERDFLIRTGRLTPFEGQKGYERKPVGPVRRRRPGAPLEPSTSGGTLDTSDTQTREQQKEDIRIPASNVNFDSDAVNSRDTSGDGLVHVEGESARKRRRTGRSSADSDEGDYEPDADESDNESSKDSDWERKKVTKSRRNGRSKAESFADLVDDADEEMAMCPSGHSSDADELETREGDDVILDNDEEIELDGGLRIPSSVYDRLFDYQKTGVSSRFVASLSHIQGPQRITYYSSLTKW